MGHHQQAHDNRKRDVAIVNVITGITTNLVCVLFDPTTHISSFVFILILCTLVIELIFMCIQVDRFTQNNEGHLTALRPTLTQVHPDDAFSTVPYEKGSAFLFYLETLLGGPGEWVSFNIN